MDFRPIVAGMSKGLTAEALLGQEPVLMIVNVVESLDFGNRKMPAVYFQGMPKPLGLNKTNAKKLIELFTHESNNWIGQQVQLYTVTTERGDGIRIRAAIAQAPALTAPTQPAAPTPAFQMPAQPATAAPAQPAMQPAGMPGHPAFAPGPPAAHQPAIPTPMGAAPPAQPPAPVESVQPLPATQPTEIETPANDPTS